MLEFGDSVVGYVSYGRNRVPALGYGGEIFELYLAPECQGCGFGRRMFEAARKDLAGHGFSNLVVWALADNDRAVGFYRRLGGRVLRRARETFGGSAARSNRIRLWLNGRSSCKTGMKRRRCRR